MIRPPQRVCCNDCVNNVAILLSQLPRQIQQLELTLGAGMIFQAGLQLSSMHPIHLAW